MRTKRVDVYYHSSKASGKGELKKCPRCKGTGEQLFKACSTCKGKGWIRV